ncbi:MAG: glutamate 5-kinase [Thermodesulfobacteriota bacterium]
MNEHEQRKKWLAGAKRIVVKVGSGVLTAGGGLDNRRVGSLARQISDLKNQRREVILVSSGAIASGFKKIGLSERPRTITQQQACAAVGQAGLMLTYEKAFARYGYKVAQILLTADDLAHRRRFLNARNTLATLLEWGIIPIINENDTVVAAEIKFGDNDTVAGLVTLLIEADLFINLTDLDGLYDRDPRRDPKARFISLVESVNPKIETMASAIPGALGAGGMFTKVRAARRVCRQGVPAVIANGKKNGVLRRLIEGRPEGTLFLPRPKQLRGRKHWIAFTAKPRGRLTIDDGAKKALLRNGKSLLPSGIVEVQDNFHMGDSVNILDLSGELVAVGLSNYSSEELRLIVGCHSRDIESRLGYKHTDEVIHRDNLVVGDDLKG